MSVYVCVCGPLELLICKLTPRPIMCLTLWLKGVCVCECVYYLLQWCHSVTGCRAEYWNEWLIRDQLPEPQASGPHPPSWSDRKDTTINKNTNKTKEENDQFTIQVLISTVINLSDCVCLCVCYLFLGKGDECSQQKACELDSIEKCQTLLMLER